MVVPLHPTELIDAIVDELAHESDALRTCSVLSRQWLASARHRNFDRCIFIGESGGESLGLESPYLRKLRAFVEFLEKEAYVCGYVRNLAFGLKLVGPGPEESGACNEKRNLRPQDLVYHVDAGLLLQVLGKMPLLETLELWQVCIEPLAASAADDIEAPPLPPSLNNKRLGLHWIPLHASDLVHIPYLFMLLPNVSDVYIINCTFRCKHYLLQDGAVAKSGARCCRPTCTWKS